MRKPCGLVICWGLWSGTAALAAGGHHAVDDAAMLEPGQCQLELWLEEGDDRRRLQHAGPACRLGAVELGLNLDRSRTRGEPRLSSWGPQLKWVTALRPGLAVGAVWAATWQDRGPRLAGQSLLLPLSWQAGESLALHLNIGRDFRRGAADVTRRGLALEWTPLPQWQGLGEYFHDGQRGHARLGLRYLASDTLSWDLSRARPRGAAGGAWWSLGISWTFEP